MSCLNLKSCLDQLLSLFFHFGRVKSCLNKKSSLNWTCLNRKTTVQYLKVVKLICFWNFCSLKKTYFLDSNSLIEFKSINIYWTVFNEIGHSLCLPLLRASTDGRCTCFVRWGSFCTTGTPLVRRGCTITQWEKIIQKSVSSKNNSDVCISNVIPV